MKMARHFFGYQPLLCLLCGIIATTVTTTAFTTTSLAKRSRGIATNENDGFCLGPVARNGLAYEDVTIGQGRRILPGDTVYCYYQGSFTKKGDGLFAKTTTTVFDEIST